MLFASGLEWWQLSRSLMPLRLAGHHLAYTKCIGHGAEHALVAFERHTWRDSSGNLLEILGICLCSSLRGPEIAFQLPCLLPLAFCSGRCALTAFGGRAKIPPLKCEESQGAGEYLRKPDEAGADSGCAG